MCDNLHHIRDVSGKPGHAFCVDHIDLSVVAVLKHLLETRAFFRISACYSEITVNVNQLKVWIFHNHVPEVLNLKVVGAFLDLLFRADSRISCGTHFLEFAHAFLLSARWLWYVPRAVFLRLRSATRH